MNTMAFHTLLLRSIFTTGTGANPLLTDKRYKVSEWKANEVYLLIQS